MTLQRQPDRAVLAGVCAGVAEHLGSDTFLHIQTDTVGTLTVRTSGEVSLNHGDHIGLTPDAAAIHRYDQKGKAIR